MRGCPTISKLVEASEQTATWLRWEQESLEDFHAYGQRFGQPGKNVYRLVLEDALRLRGLSLQQLRDKAGL
jgi:hypothetical protein